MEVERNGELRVAQEEASQKAQVARMERVREVAKEAQKACKELSKARKDAEREAGGVRDAMQRGVPFDPGVITLVNDLVARLAGLESQSGALS